ncbi:MAG: PAS domain-containing protein [Oligoflexia bacterium]|nr:PAS domain-containing protein [Oligoflexia bacterium]MBF0364420.1 PAS domain-containing protein [Oligoflexia bacterium]
MVGENRYQKIFETILHGLVCLDENGRITEANSSAIKILGIALEKMQEISDPDSYWRSTDENGMPFSKEGHPALKVLRDGRAVQNLMVGIYVPTIQEKKWLLANVTKLSDRCVCVCFSDITTQKLRIQEELAASGKEALHCRVALKNVLQQIEEEKNLIRSQVALNIERNIKPLLLKMNNIIQKLPANESGVIVGYTQMMEHFLNEINSDFYKKLENIAHLTASEARVAHLIKAGKTIKEVALHLNISNETVKKHITHIKKKMGIVATSKNHPRKTLKGHLYHL